MSNKLEQLKAMTTIVADTGDFKMIEKYNPIDATTNPTLIFAACSQEENKELILQAANNQTVQTKAQIDNCIDRLLLDFAARIQKLITGYVSIEIDSRLSYDTEATVSKAKELLEKAKDKDVDTQRILFKIASTWEGIKAAEILEKEGIHCNLTLLFGFAQAAACADAQVFLISPFVGRILDWYKKNNNKDSYPPEEDPGVLFVSEIYKYYKKNDFKTIIMGASFRSQEEIEELAGCDRLTIAPKFLESLKQDDGTLKRKLTPEMDLSDIANKTTLDETSFHQLLKEDQMAAEKLSEGIANFNSDIEKLEQLILDLTR